MPRLMPLVPPKTNTFLPPKSKVKFMFPPSHCGHAAVDGNDLAGDEPACVRREHGDQPLQVFRPADAP